MATNKIPASVLQAYLAQQPPDTEINLTTLVTELADKSLQEALDFFSTLPETDKVVYLIFFYNYYFYCLTDTYVFTPQDVFTEHTVEEIDAFIMKYNLNTTEIVPLRKLVSSMQKLTAKQRQHRKEGFQSES